MLYCHILYCSTGSSSNIILNCNSVRLGVYMVKLCHEKMLILRCILKKNLNVLQKNNLTSHPWKTLFKKLNSLGIILIPRENLKPLEKYQPSPPIKIPIYKKNIIPCKSFNLLEKPQPS